MVAGVLSRPCQQIENQRLGAANGPAHFKPFETKQTLRRKLLCVNNRDLP
jgi:hypothetical protein